LPQGTEGQARIVILVAVFFLAGIALSALWFKSSSSPKKDVAPPADAALSGATLAVLEHLDSPVEVRFYSYLDPASVPGSVQAFAGRAEKLLSQYEQASGGKVKVTRLTSRSNFNATAASKAGIKAFNIDKGDACFLGLTVARAGRQETLPELAPEWEQALESDLTRAIARVAPPTPAPPVTQTDTADLDAVRRSIPNLDTISLDEATRLLRENGLAEFRQTAQEMEAKVNAAQQRYLAAQSSQSEAEQQAALQEFQQAQAEQTDRLKQVAAASKARLDALQRLKSPGH
jgi:pyruvate-formate lyase